MPICEVKYIYEGVLVWIIPSTYQSRVVIHLIFLLRAWQGWSPDNEDLMYELKFEYTWSVWRSSSCIGPGNGDVRHKVYLWGFFIWIIPLTYWFHESITMFIQLVLLTLALNAYFSCLNAYCMCILTTFCSLSTPRVGFLPLGGQYPDPLLMGCAPLGESCLYTPRRDVPSREY